MKIWLAAVPAVLIVISFGHAYGAFDSDGNYYCNSANLPLEETIYKSSVAKIDESMQDYLSLNPDATDQEMHTYLISNPAVSESYSIMAQSKACLQSNGISPVAIAVPSPLLLEIFAAPEFGVVSSLVLVATLASVVVLQNRINRFEIFRN